MGEEFLLRWNDYQAAIASMMESLCLTEEMVDCTLTAGRTSFSAHRMVLSTCSPYFRSLFASVPSHQHPVIFVRDVESSILELLVRYMYSGQVSVSEEQLVPLVQAAKSLSIKGLLDVPVHQRPAESPSPRLPPTQSPLDLPAARQSEPAGSKQRNPARPPLPSPSSSSSSSCPPPPSQASHPSLPSPQQRKLPPRSSPVPASKSSEASGEAEHEEAGEEAMEEEVEKEEEEGEGVDPTLLGDLHHTQLLRRLTSEVTAFPFPGGGEDCPALPQSYSCEHCGKEFTSKRKHQRHVLNVHFGYNPVQCPFCNKGHRDNYNLKQHVCPVLNMKYGVFERKEGEAGDSATGGIVGRPPGSGSSLAPSQLLQAALTLAKRPDS